MRRDGIAGVAVVHVQVNAQGVLGRFDILRAGHPLIEAATRQCLRQHFREFEPATGPGGAPVAWAWRFPIRYRSRN